MQVFLEKEKLAFGKFLCSCERTVRKSYFAIIRGLLWLGVAHIISKRTPRVFVDPALSTIGIFSIFACFGKIADNAMDIGNTLITFKEDLREIWKEMTIENAKLAYVGVWKDWTKSLDFQFDWRNRIYEIFEHSIDITYDLIYNFNYRLDNFAEYIYSWWERVPADRKHNILIYPRRIVYYGKIIHQNLRSTQFQLMELSGKILNFVLSSRNWL